MEESIRLMAWQITMGTRQTHILPLKSRENITTFLQYHEECYAVEKQSEKEEPKMGLGNRDGRMKNGFLEE